MDEHGEEAVEDVETSGPPEAQLSFEGFDDEDDSTEDEVLEASDDAEYADDGDESEDDDALAASPHTAESDRIARLERELAEQNEALYKLSKHREPELDNGPPIDPANIETWEQAKEYDRWERQRDLNELRASMAADAEAAASEQRARGLYSSKDMGQGRDYDAMVARHITPVEKAAPGIREFFKAQKDPATARYALASVLEILDRAGGDPVKGFASLWRQVDKKGSATADVIGKIGKAAEAQVGRSAMKGSRSGGGGRRELTAEDIDAMSVSEFAQKFPHLA